MSKRILCLFLSLLLVIGLAACSGQEEPEPSAPEATPTPAVTEVPEETPSPEPEATPIATPYYPASDLIPVESDIVPGSFEALFSLNPYDARYDQEYEDASSFSMMRQACDDAASRWLNMVNYAYEKALEILPADQAASLREGQEDWLSVLETRVQVIRDNAGSDTEGILTAAREIVLLYRDRAQELCRVIYEATGALPDFPDFDAGPVG